VVSILVSNILQKEIILDGIELINYEGEDLSSINDFRDNSIKGYQYITKENYELEITGLVEKPQSFSYNETINLFPSYKEVITLYCVEGWDVKMLWEGPLVKDILETADISEEANTIIFHAYDGYTTSFPIEYIIDNDIMLAYKLNNVTLPPERGFPFQLVSESKWGYKWIKWVTEIELSDDVDYEGYWESRGYSNEGDLNKSFFD
jgi:DMSO/TMAO reductase YedYZ molybdopterin-dependent catalytic subunit